MGTSLRTRPNCLSRGAGRGTLTRMPSDDQENAPSFGTDDGSRSDEPSPDTAAESADGATVPDAATNGAGLEEDDPTLLDPAVRSLEPDSAIIMEEQAPPPGVVADSPVGPPGDVGGDADAIVDDVADREALLDTQRPEFTPHERVAHRTAVELKHIETEVRELLEQFDTRRKRKLSGTRRWRELEDDILRWRFSGRFDEEALGRLQRLVARRHHLFHRLRFFADTRVRWNS